MSRPQVPGHLGSGQSRPWGARGSPHQVLLTATIAPPAPVLPADLHLS